MLNTSWSLLAARMRRRPKLRLCGNSVPSVDVFITCCGEDENMIVDTVKAACQIDYPQYRRRVIVLDDADSASLSDKISNLSRAKANVLYYARPKPSGKSHGFKAGNLNAGLKFVKGLGEGEFGLVLDADMIPERAILRALLPHMLKDQRLGIVSPGQVKLQIIRKGRGLRLQNHYNIPVDDPLFQSFAIQNEIAYTLQDGVEAAWCTGTGFIFRQSLIPKFHTETLAEDLYCSHLLLGQGYKVQYLREDLQCGLVPEDYASHLTQRIRWVRSPANSKFVNMCSALTLSS